MSKSLIVENTIEIHGTTAQVWDALVNPAQTKKYMFGCEALSDWKPGSELLWQGEQEGKPIVYVKGTIKEIRPEEFLSYTTIDPFSNIDGTSSTNLMVTYSLKPQGEKTILTVTQGDYSQVNEGQRRYDEAINAGGWSSLLVEIKKLVEGE